ncbi:ESPR-type extended signal peptide-containing protein [Histophilus somni]|uniref:ESPR-type extended signal peptide-containing protein n=1 Tax=Histophilus somni TaxID=731 RepID=UPI00094B745E|nr:ESPR-type extended signal peptide-containing protein [Histophilus somni]
MNKIFKTKYDVTTGQTKVVSELANNRQVASRVEGSSVAEKCGDFLGNFLGAFKVLPLALVLAGFFGLSSISYAAVVYIDMEATTGAAGVRQDWRESQYWKNRGSENILIAPVQADSVNQNLKRYGRGINTRVQKSVIIGPMAAGRDDQAGMTVLGHGAVGYSSQTTAIGNNVYTGGEQATAIGSDVMAAGYASIAIGNDDIYSQGGYSDTLPQETIEQIYGYNRDPKYTGNTKGITYQEILDKNDFNKKYGKTQSTDNRHYSPTYAAGVGSIAIGSRSVAFGDASLSIGTLSFALGKNSTAVGVRAFVDTNADGGVAIGDESRVFAPNSFAIGNEAEASNQGSLSYGSGARAVGKGSISIGQNTSSNAMLKIGRDKIFADTIMEETHTANPEVTAKAQTIDVNYTNGELKFGDNNELVKKGFRYENFDDKGDRKKIRFRL